MIADMWTVIWKEYKELLSRDGILRGGKFSILLFVGVFGVFLPWQFGRAWGQSPMLLAYWVWVPLLLVTSTIADSFAGERERHTLESLLATRLSDRAILFGKFAAAVAYGWGLTMISLLLGLITINLTHPMGTPFVYPPLIGLTAVMSGLLASALAAAIGIFVSLRAATVKQAQQTLSITIMLLVLAPVLVMQMLPDDSKSGLFRALASWNLTQVVLLAGAVLALLDVGLLAAAMARFRRARLILD